MSYQPPPYPPTGPPSKLLPHQRAWQWYKSRKPLTKLGLGCLSLVIILSVCLCSAAAAANGTTPQATQPTPTASIAAQIATDTPTSLPTATDTPAPTATPTLTPTAKPTAKPTQKPTPTPKPHCSGVNGNPWCYDFNAGNLIYTPPSGFCGYFNCIPTFYAPDDPGDGYIVECSDSTFSQSGGESGACSHHGGVMRPLYSH